MVSISWGSEVGVSVGGVSISTISSVGKGWGSIGSLVGVSETVSVSDWGDLYPLGWRKSFHVHRKQRIFLKLTAATLATGAAY